MTQKRIIRSGLSRPPPSRFWQVLSGVLLTVIVCLVGLCGYLILVLQERQEQTLDARTDVFVLRILYSDGPDAVVVMAEIEPGSDSHRRVLKKLAEWQKKHPGRSPLGGMLPRKW